MITEEGSQIKNFQLGRNSIIYKTILFEHHSFISIILFLSQNKIDLFTFFQIIIKKDVEKKIEILTSAIEVIKIHYMNVERLIPIDDIDHLCSIRGKFQ